MKATLTVVLELLEPAHVQTAEDLARLDPAQIKSLAIKLVPLGGQGSTVTARVGSEETSIGELLDFLKEAEAENTTVELWFRGRSEQILI